MKLQTAKNVVRQMSKTPCLRAPFDSEHAQGSQTLPESVRHFIIFFINPGEIDLVTISFSDI